MSNRNALLTQDTELEEAWNLVLAELEHATEQPHPFRYLTLATIDARSFPDQRMVVLRELDGDREFVVYTDARSKKVIQINDNSSVSLLFYNSDKKVQVTVNGQASVISEGGMNQRLWEKSVSEKPHSYTSITAPGKPIDNPQDAYDWDLKNPENFCVLIIKASKITFLQLDGHRHLRSSRTLNEGNRETQWIAP